MATDAVRNLAGRSNARKYLSTMKQPGDNQNHQNRPIAVITGWWRQADVGTDLNRVLVLILLALGVGFIFDTIFIWPKQYPSSTNQPDAQINQVSMERAYQLARHQQAVIVDTRGSSSYADKHIAGALNLPPAQFRTRYADFARQVDKNQTVILYCAPGCASKEQTAWQLQEYSYEDVYVMTAGVEQWAAAGHPVATGQDTHHAAGEGQ